MDLYDVVIVGAGPAGISCALAMKDSGLKVLVIDKSNFPRDKVCGDAIPYSALRVLQLLDEKYLSLLKEFPHKMAFASSKIIAPSGRSVIFNFKFGSYTIPRLQFDHFLLELAERDSGADFIKGSDINNITIRSECVEISTKHGKTFRSKLIIGCDGAQSVVNRKLTSTVIDHNHYIGAVRSYYQNIAGTDPHTLEVHMFKEYMPGYFWIFPLANNIYNVGFGMLSSAIKRKKVNLRHSLLDIIQSNAVMNKRFANAVALDDPIGYGLPTGSRKVQISGVRFMLAGDAASLIDPISGEGIGNAMLSGLIAGRHAVRSFKENNFSSDFMKLYDKDIDKNIRNGTRNKYFLQRFVGEKVWLIEKAVEIAANNPWLKEKMMTFF